MATEIVVPRLGWTMEEGIFGEWLKQDGDSIAVGDLLYTMETDKATQEVEALESGILRIAPDGPETGDVVAVGTLLGYLVAVGENAPLDSAVPVPAAAPAQVQVAGQSTAGGPGATDRPRRSRGPAISPRARRVAKELDVAWADLTGSGQNGRIVERDIRAAALQQVSTAEVRVTPVARRLAEEAGIDLATVTPKKAGGRIQREDVEAAIAARSAPPMRAPEPAPLRPPAGGESIPAGRIRILTAQRMADSAHTAAAVTLVTEADATALVALREQLKAAFEPRNLPVPTYNDLLIKLVAVALQAHPALNSTWNGTELILFEDIHVGLAVDTDEGLLVPVVHDAHRKGVRQIAADTASLVEKARVHRLGVDDLQGGTFTITNLGMYGIDAFTPIINLPQTAILGVGRIVAKPAVVDDQVVPRKLVTLSLTFDHRAVDGGPAARFLNTIREFVEKPALWMLD